MADERAILQVTSVVEDGGAASVVLRWEAVDGVVGYNLYRRRAEERQGSGRRINGERPITLPSSARQFRAVVPAESPEWQSLARAFGADPAVRFERGLTAHETAMVSAGAQASLPLGQAAGLAFVDRKVADGERYLYELRGVLADGVERRLAFDVPVWVGHWILPDPPSGLTAQAGDRRALVLWNRNPFAATFAVQRATSPGGPYQQVNPKPVAFDRDTDIDGAPLAAPQPAFLDIGAWDTDGLPTSHPVAGVNVSGPDDVLVSGGVAGLGGTGGRVVGPGGGDAVPEHRADGARQPPGVADHCRRWPRPFVAEGRPQRREPPDP
jgi:hypothetical protein